MPVLQQTPAANIILEKPVDTGWAYFAFTVHSTCEILLEIARSLPAQPIEFFITISTISRLMKILSSSHPDCSIAHIRIEKRALFRLESYLDTFPEFSSTHRWNPLLHIYVQEIRTSAVQLRNPKYLKKQQLLEFFYLNFIHDSLNFCVFITPEFRGSLVSPTTRPSTLPLKPIALNWYCVFHNKIHKEKNSPWWNPTNSV